MMKKAILIMLAALLCVQAGYAQDYVFADASTYTMVGKLFPDTPNPYHRVDTKVHTGFSSSELAQVKMSAGIIIAFRTDSPSISVKPYYDKEPGGGTTAPLSRKGFDLYAKKDGKWLWAGCTLASKSGGQKNVLNSNNIGMTDYLLYLPLFMELNKLEIGIWEGYTIEPIDNPFRHRIGIFGSSFTHGYSTSRPGMTYSAQLSRMTGLQFLNLGCSGNSKLQTYFADVLAAADVDALVFDSFSNPTAEMIQERLFEFIEIIQASHPDIPLIFQKTIRREARNFNEIMMAKEEAKIEMAESMMRKACRKYKNVFYVTTTNATDENHETTVDGTHPGDYGYTLWARSVAEPISEILAQYGIK